MSRILLFVLILAASNFAQRSVYGQSANSSPQKQQDNAQNLPKNGVATPDSKSVIGQGKAGDANAHHSEKRRTGDPEERIARFTKYGFWIGFAQLAIAAAGIYYVIKTLRVTQRQTREIIEQTKEFAKQSTEFANQTKLMRDNHIAEQRPWLSVNIFTDERFKNTSVDNEPGYIWIARCETENHGSSPALNIAFSAELKAFKLEDPIPGHIAAARRLGEELKEKGVLRRNEWVEIGSEKGA